MDETWYAMRSDSESPAGDDCGTAEQAAAQYWSDTQWDAEHAEPPESVTVVRAVFRAHTQYSQGFGDTVAESISGAMNGNGGDSPSALSASALEEWLKKYFLYWEEGERRVMPRPAALARSRGA